MTTVLIVIHLMVVLAMIGLVLLQRSEGGALGIGGGGGAFMTGRSAANVLTRATAILAVAFFATSLGLAILARLASSPSDILSIPGAPAQIETGIPAPQLPAAPQSAEDLLESLGGAGGLEETPAEPAPPAPGAAAPADAAAPASSGAATGSSTAPADGAEPATEAPPATP